MTTKPFFETVFGTDKTGFIEVATDQFHTNYWFEWPRQADFMEKYIGMRTDEDVWYSINLYEEKRREADVKAWGRSVYMDADTCHPSNFRVPPTVVVETSEGRWQCYWVLDKAHTSKEIQDVAKRISVAHEKQGCDPSGWIPTKMLRIPTTSNLKYDIPQRVKESGGSGEIYSLDEISGAYADIDVSKAREIISQDLPTYLPKTITVIEKIPVQIDHLYYEEVPSGGSWSGRMWALMLGLFRAGFSRDEVFVASKRAKCNKYDPANAGKFTQTGVPIPERRDPDGTLWREVLKAEEAYQSGEFEEEVEGPEKTTAPSLVKDRVAPKADFLTPEERQLLVDRGGSFIDTYCEWVSKRTDSAYAYQRSLALMLLSVAYGNVGYIVPKFGKMDLNLWLLIVGDTTYSRKSTARDLYLMATHAIERRVSSKIDIGSDFTAEGLNATLATRDGLTSLIHRDEIHGFFNEMFTKGYMAGAVERLTDLYSGKVQVTMRSTKGASQDKRVSTVLNMIGMGTPEGLGEVLTEGNFRSGFLARFEWAFAVPPKVITADMVDIEERGQETDSLSGDGELDEMISDVLATYEALGADSGKKFAIRFEADALQRFNEWGHLVLGVGENDTYATEDKSVRPSVERMRWSVYKSAALIALHEGHTSIRLEHILVGIEQAEYWYDSLIEMADLISSSEFAKQVRDVEMFIASSSSSRRTRSAIYRNFRSYRTSEVSEWIDSLVAQGVAEASKSHVWIAGTNEGS